MDDRTHQVNYPMSAVSRNGTEAEIDSAFAEAIRLTERVRVANKKAADSLRYAETIEKITALSRNRKEG